MTKIEIKRILTDHDLKTAFAIRQRVFVEEQQVDAREEYDEFESESVHFLAYADGKPVGTARWRRYGKNIKLERFAVLKEARGNGVGDKLVKFTINDLPEIEGEVFLHAQLQAMPLYARNGFEKVGPMFEEANIQHYKMVLKR